MIGIDVDLLESIISRNDSGLTDFKNSSRKMLDCFDDMDDSYTGQILSFISNGLSENKNDLKKVEQFISNNSNVLSSLKQSYIKQDQIFSEQLSNIISNN